MLILGTLGSERFNLNKRSHVFGCVHNNVTIELSSFCFVQVAGNNRKRRNSFLWLRKFHALRNY